MKRSLLTACLVALLLSGCQKKVSAVTMATNRAETDLAPLAEHFRKRTGIPLTVTYTDDLAAAATTHDVLLDQGGATLAAVPTRSIHASTLKALRPYGKTAGGAVISLRMPILAYQYNKVEARQLPETSEDLLQLQWAGKVGCLRDEPAATWWKRAMTSDRGADETGTYFSKLDLQFYDSEEQMLADFQSGKLLLLLLRIPDFMRLKENKSFPGMDHCLEKGDPLNAAHPLVAGITSGTSNNPGAQILIGFLLSQPTQKFFSEVCFELPSHQDENPHRALPGLHPRPLAPTE